MPFYKVPSPNNTSLPDGQRSKPTLSQAQAFSPDPPPSSSSSRAGHGSSVQHINGGLPYLNGGVVLVESSVDDAPETTSNSFHGDRSDHSYLTRASEINGNRNGTAVPDQQVSIVELEIQQQSEREAELQAMRQSLYQQTSSSSSTSDNHAKRTSGDVPDRHSFTELRPRIQTGSASHQNRNHVPPHPRSPSASFSSSSSASSSAVMTYEEAISTAAHPGENLIVREIMELKQREEELRMRRREGGAGGAGGETKDNSSELRGNTRGVQGHPNSSSFHSSVSPGVQSVASSDDHTPRNGDAVIDVTGRRAPRIRPLDEPDSSSPFLPQKETPIERETRLIREREEALRQARGLPTAAAADDGVAVVEVEVTGGGALRSSVDRKTDQTMKKLASSRLMVEIEKEKQRELELRSQSNSSSSSSSSHSTTNGSLGHQPAKTNLYHRRY